MCKSDWHIAACVEITSLNGDPGAPRNGPLRWLNTGEVWSLEKKKYIFFSMKYTLNFMSYKLIYKSNHEIFWCRFVLCLLNIFKLKAVVQTNFIIWQLWLDSTGWKFGSGTKPVSLHHPLTKGRKITYHKCEWPGGEGSVVIYTVPHTHLNLSFLDPVASGILQQTHNSVNQKVQDSLV